MKVDQSGQKWMKVDERGWNQIEMDGSEWMWMKEDESVWKWMKEEEGGWKWAKVCETGWQWMKMDKGGSKRLYRWPQKGPNKQPARFARRLDITACIKPFLYICYQSIYSSFPSIHLLSIWIIVIPRCYSISDGLVFLGVVSNLGQGAIRDDCCTEMFRGDGNSKVSRTSQRTDWHG